MSLIDVTDLLFDVDIAGDAIQITRALRTVDATGRTQDSFQVINTIGNIQPASGEQLQTVPEEQRVGAFMTVYVPIPLIPLSQTNAPDLVLINGQQYRCISAMPFGNYGQGYWTGVVQLTDTVLSLSP